MRALDGGSSFREAQERAERAMQRQAAIQDDKVVLLSLFQRIAEANGSEAASHEAADHLETEDLALFILAMDPSSRISGVDFRALLKEFGVCSSTKIHFTAFERWWNEMGCLHKGVAAKYFCVAQSGAFDAGSAALWANECVARIRGFEEEQAIVKLQTQVRQWLAHHRYILLKSENALPGSHRLLVTKVQSFWRMFLERAQYRKFQRASILIQTHVRAKIARAVFLQALSDNQTEGYDLASNTVHVGGVGKQWEDERMLADYFESEFGTVLATVVRYRAPDLPKHPYNSWALVTFKASKTVRKIFEQAGIQDSGEVDAARAPPTAMISPDASITFIVRTIDPAKAMNSTGSFGKIFQECRDRVKRVRAALRRAAEQKRRAEAFSRRRIAELATPAVSSPQKLMMMAHSRHLVVREYADGWLYCRTEGPSTEPPSHREQATCWGDRRHYWFNTNTAETRWSAPPSLARLDKTVNLNTQYAARGGCRTRCTARHANLATPVRPSPRQDESTRRAGAANPGALPVLSSTKTIYSTSLPRSPLMLQVSLSGGAWKREGAVPQRRRQRLPLHIAVGEADVPPLHTTVQQLPKGTGSPGRGVATRKHSGKGNNASPRERQPKFTPSSPHRIDPERTSSTVRNPRYKHASLSPATSQEDGKQSPHHGNSAAPPHELHLGAESDAASEPGQPLMPDANSLSQSSKSTRAKGRWRTSGAAVVAMRRLLGDLSQADAAADTEEAS